MNNENINKEQKHYKQKLNEILMCKNTITEVKILLEGFKSRLHQKKEAVKVGQLKLSILRNRKKKE